MDWKLVPQEELTANEKAIQAFFLSHNLCIAKYVAGETPLYQWLHTLHTADGDSLHLHSRHQDLNAPIVIEYGYLMHFILTYAVRFSLFAPFLYTGGGNKIFIALYMNEAERDDTEDFYYFLASFPDDEYGMVHMLEPVNQNGVTSIAFEALASIDIPLVNSRYAKLWEER